MTKLLDDVARAIDNSYGHEKAARAALTVVAQWLREPSEELIETVTGGFYGSKWNDTEHAPGAKMKEVWKGYTNSFLRALASHLEKEMG